MSRDFETSSSQYLNNANAVLTAAPLSMACWFKSENSVSTQTFINIGLAASDDHRFTLRVVANTSVRFSVRTTAASEAISTAGPTVNTWNHAAGVEIATNSRAAYLNGANKGTQGTTRVPVGVNSTYIGAMSSSPSPSNFMDGFIAEVGIWNIALNDSEVAALARGVCPLRIRPSGLVSYWPIFGVGSPEPDYRGGFHMTLNAAPPQADHAPVMPPFFREDWYGEFTTAAPAAGQPIVKRMGGVKYVHSLGRGVW